MQPLDKLRRDGSDSERSGFELNSPITDTLLALHKLAQFESIDTLNTRLQVNKNTSYEAVKSYRVFFSFLSATALYLLVTYQQV